MAESTGKIVRRAGTNGAIHALPSRVIVGVHA
jgi:hypothetical protein